MRGNIEGLSEATLEKFITLGYIREYADIFHLDRYQEEIQSLEGFGEKFRKGLIRPGLGLVLPILVLPLIRHKQQI